MSSDITSGDLIILPMQSPKSQMFLQCTCYATRWWQFTATVAAEPLNVSNAHRAATCRMYLKCSFFQAARRALGLLFNFFWNGPRSLSLERVARHRSAWGCTASQLPPFVVFFDTSCRPPPHTTERRFRPSLATFYRGEKVRNLVSSIPPLFL